MAGKLPAGTFDIFAVNSPVFRIVLQANPASANRIRKNWRVKKSLFCKLATVFGSRKILAMAGITLIATVFY
jgi:hypothetical protein